ncbi:MAG: bifunctional pyr operon transcriptional regulator/uracil phosphoribosyltransferase PyrR [Elusimicrobia bacterium]|nr:bifunctional pyr operon transcriptional regulator/uracil phosphoribosyltransferase PyrR [Elusimicrobiota bacterium]MBU2614076.1 bifunctional pyr operon transcriptional regulator/uracil phosphoribosyltransferase PyrR [Elusimicrobiota bacterium]
MSSRVILTAKEINTAIKHLADEIIQVNQNLNDIVIIGIVTRGVCLAERLIKEINKAKGTNLKIGSLDITFYRDDLNSIATQPIAKETQIPFDLTDKIIILVDDVLYTGRSTRAAMDAIMDFARPKCIQLAVLIDRGHRELPIQADYVGKKIESEYSDQVQVKLKEIDKNDKVVILNVDKK